MKNEFASQIEKEIEEKIKANEAPSRGISEISDESSSRASST
jgi:hypothetical protein